MPHSRGNETHSNLNDMRKYLQHPSSKISRYSKERSSFVPSIVASWNAVVLQKKSKAIELWPRNDLVDAVWDPRLHGLNN